MAAWLPRVGEAAAGAAVARVCANLARADLGADPLFPTAILSGRRLVGSPLDERRTSVIRRADRMEDGPGRKVGPFARSPSS